MRLKDYLAKEGITQREFAEKMNPPLQQSHLSNYMSGRVKISLARAIEIQRLTKGAVKPESWLEQPDE